VLLLAIFSAAGDQVRPIASKGSGKTQAELANLREQLLNAFIPGDATEFVMRASGSIDPPI
jgi:hypothetical protein